MGIKDLLRFMKPYTEPIHVQKYAGKRVGIDAYSWLHKGAYSCSMELCLNSEGDKKFQYINYFMHRINLLRHHKITPVVVFDGGNIPCKAGTENDRYRRRKANREMAMEKLREGNVGGATELFQRAISITPAMAHQLIQTLRSENVEFVVAPYEADAQLAYLSSLGEQQGGIVAVISEDSDLLAYGCPAIMFKMDKFGNAEEIVLDKVFNSANSKPSFKNFDAALFIDMCVLAGCDFLPSIPGIGIAKAHALVTKYRNIDRVLSVLKLKKGKQVPDDYSRSFSEAVAVFQHARIYNRNSKQLEHMKPLSEELLEKLGEELDFLGPDMAPTMAIAIAEGNLDPVTMEAYECSLSNRSQQHLARISEQREVILKDKNDSHDAPVLPRSVPAMNFQSDVVNHSESCFTVYSSQKKGEKKIPSTMMLQRQVLKERNFSYEAVALAKLAGPLEVQNDKENSTVSDALPLKTPDNNPFKKRKLHSENTERTPAQQSGVTEVGGSETLCQTPDSQESVSSKPRKVDISLKAIGKTKSKTSNCKISERTSSRVFTALNVGIGLPPRKLPALSAGGKMGSFFNLFLLASMPVLKVLFISAIGLFLAFDRIDILGENARHHLNRAVFYVFSPAFVGVKLAKTVTLKSFRTLWFMPVNILITFVIGSALGWALGKVTRAPKHIKGLILASCSAGNLGVMLIIIVPAICKEKGSPFGAPDVCETYGLTYASLSMAIGSIYLWLYVYNILKISTKEVVENEVSNGDGIKEQLPGITSANNAQLLPSVQRSPAASLDSLPNSSAKPAVGLSSRIRQCSRFITKWINLKALLAPSTIGAMVFTIGLIPTFRKLLMGDNAPLHVVEDTTSTLGDATIPCITLILGANLLRGLKGSGIQLKFVFGIIAVRYIFLPLLGILIVKGAVRAGLVQSDDRLFQFILLLQYAIPPAMSIGTMTQLFGTGQSDCSVIMLWTYALASAALTLWSTLFLWLVGS